MGRFDYDVLIYQIQHAMLSKQNKTTQSCVFFCVCAEMVIAILINIERANERVRAFERHGPFQVKCC